MEDEWTRLSVELVSEQPRVCTVSESQGSVVASGSAAAVSGGYFRLIPNVAPRLHGEPR